MNVVSGCCHRSVEVGYEFEFPTGKPWSIRYGIEYCTCCGMKFPTLVEECETCGVVGCPGNCD